MLNNGEVPIYEPGLEDLMAKNVDAGRLTFSLELAEAIQGADAVFIAVGTPTRRGDAPALTIIPALVGGGAKVRVTDPQGIHEGKALLPGVTWVEDAYEAAEGTDLVVVLTEWNEFRGLDLSRIAQHMETPRMADLRNIYSDKDARKAGFEAYVSIGRSPMTGAA